MKKILIIILLIFFSHTAQAYLPTIISAKGTATTNAINVETIINTNNTQITLWAEYSTQEYFGNISQTNHLVVENFRGNQTIFIDVPNLNPETLYYLRIVANNGNDTVVGEGFAVMTLKDPNQIQEKRTTIKSTTDDTTIPIYYDAVNTNVRPSKLDLFILSFFPQGIINWIAFTIVILMLIVLFRKLHVEHKSHH